MPVDPSLITAGIAGLNTMSSLWTNHQQQKFSSKMYGRQYDDSIKFWNMQNAYNSPEAQMQRFRNAGLNPNLIYGQGNSGNAGSIPTPDVTPVNFREPKIEGPITDAMQQLLMRADLKIKNAQADNLAVQNEVIRQDANLRRIQFERGQYDLGFERSLTDVSADARREALRSRKIQNDVTLNRDAREAAINASNVKEAAQRMLTLIEQRKAMPLERGRIRADTDRIRQDISNMVNTGKLQEMDMRLREKGINPSDPLWARYVGMFLSDIYEGRVTAGDIGSGIWSWLFGN